MTGDSLSLESARAMDAADPLRHLRARFALPDGLRYFDGHSLGPAPREAPERLRDVAQRQWSERLIRSWIEAGWIDAPRRVGAKIAALIGAKADEVLVADSTSVNLFKLMAAATQLSGRRTILTESGNFHTDRYVAAGAAELLGLRLELASRERVLERIGPDTAVLLLTHVHYRTSERFDMAAVTARAREAGAMVLWDLSHSAGAVPLQLGEDGVELAVGCGYKYLNGGPGAPAFLFVAEHLHDRMVSPIRGWLGHSAPFDFADDYRPAAGIDRFMAGTPPILSLAALECGLDAFDGVELDALWAKSAQLFDFFAAAFRARCPELECISPAEPSQRGSHIAFRHANAYEVCRALIEADVIGDFRAPDVIRFGLAPLYTRFEDVWRAVETCAEVLREEGWRDPRYAARAKVT